MGVLWQKSETEEDDATHRIHKTSKRTFLCAVLLSGLLLIAAMGFTGKVRVCLGGLFAWSLIASTYAAMTYWRARSYRTRKVRELGVTDSLTGLPNRKGLMAELERCETAPQEYGKRIRLIDIDFINLNRVNYEFGDMVGDAVLQDIASLLQNLVPKGNPVGRLGGDEFLVIMPQSSGPEAQALADAIRQAISEYRLNLAERGEVHSLKANVSVADYLPEQASLHETVIGAKEGTAHGRLTTGDEDTHKYYHVPRVTLGAFAVVRWQNLSKAEQEEFKLWKRELTSSVTERMAAQIVELLDEKADTNWGDFVTTVPTASGGRIYASRELAQAVAKQLGVPYRDVMRADASGPESRSIEPAVDAVIDKGDGVLLVSDVISSGLVERRAVKRLSAAGAHTLVVAWAAY